MQRCHNGLGSSSIVVLLMFLWGLAAATATGAQGPPDPARVKALAAMLPESPCGVGRPIGDRRAWQAVAEAPPFREVVARAERLMASPLPEADDDLYLDFSRTGNRRRYERLRSQRHARFAELTLAECIENRGRFLPAIEESITAVCAEKSWVYPAHDSDLGNFKGTTITIDLGSSATSWNLATANYWLGDRLSPATRTRIRKELHRRTFEPFESYVETGRPRLWWATCTNNWNAVCLAGVTGSALAAIDDRDRRAFYAAAAEKFVGNFLAGFTPDGYCSEGLGYWNYGFGHYVLLSETLYQATGGRVDLMEAPPIPAIARFPVRMEVVPGVYPAFADCGVGTLPDARLMAFLSRRFGWGLEEYERRALLLAGGPSSSLFTVGVYGFPNSASQRPAATRAAEKPLRDWFADAGILIGRPATTNRRALAVALKGGHNAEHHNHNDVGSFLVALEGQTPLVDPGSEIYTARTFGRDRYTSGVLNSFGHPVPIVAGKLQKTGRSAAAQVLETEFTDAADTIALDLRAAYDVGDLKKLVRRFDFSREGTGRLTVTDEVAFTSPQSFGTALITFSNWRKQGDDALVVGEGPGAVQVRVDTGTEPWELKAEKIDEDLPGGRIPIRLGIDLTRPVEKAVVRLTIVPAQR